MESPQETPSSSTPDDNTTNGNEQSISVQKYNSEWQQLSSGIGEVRRRALTGALRVSRMRSVAWAILLDVLPPESEQWLEVIRTNRNKYDLLKEKYACNPRETDHTVDDPLSQNDESEWNKYFCNLELQSTIKLDVVRTFPGVEFFRQSDIRKTMNNVLFIFARETPDLLYRQGMHEILAPLLFIIHSDHRAAEYVTLDENLTEIMNPSFMEHDSYTLFKAMMDGIEKFYSSHETTSLILNPTTPGFRNSNMKDSSEMKLIENEVVRYLRLLKEQTLSTHDADLTKHFEKCDIPLSLFGVRWLRVLFGREFHLQDLFVLWDAILAEGNDFSFAGFVLVSMLIAIRTPLLNSDSMECLTILLNYPTSIDVQYIIDYALYLKHPDLYCKPATRTFNCFTDKKNKTNIRQIFAEKSSKMSSIETKKNIPKTQKVKIATSVEDGVIDGDLFQEIYTREELTHAHNIMSVCDMRLSEYEEILRKALPKSTPNFDTANNALNGIKELRTLLKSRYRTQFGDIEPALEVNESVVRHKEKEVPQAKQNLPVTKESIPSRTPLNKEVQMKSFETEHVTEVTNDKNLPCINPFGTTE